MRKIKVAFFAEKWTSGGIEAFIINLLQFIDREKFSVKIIVAQNEWNGLDDKLKKLDVEKAVILKDVIDNPINRVIKTLQKFDANIDDNSIDILHLNIFNGVGLIYAYLAKKKGIKKVIVHSHNSNIQKSNSRFIKMIAHKVCKKLFADYPDIYCGCSNDALNFISMKKNKKQKLIIPNGIIMSRFVFNEEKRKLTRQKLKINNEILIGNIGRLTTQKNQEFLLKITKWLVINGYPIKLMIVGSGELEDYLKKKCKDLKIEDNVIWYGTCSDIENIYQAFDVFVLPSFFEGLPMVLLEAQAAGLPCVISDTIADEGDLVNGKLIKRLSVEMPENIWGNTIIESYYSIKRKNLIQELLDSKYNVTVSVKQVETIYLNN